MSVISVQIVQQGAAIPGNTRVSTSVVVTDTAGPQAAVVLTGTEIPPWSFSATVNGSGSIVASDLDASGAVIGTPVTQPYTVTAPQLATSAITVTVTS